MWYINFPDSSVGKESAYNAGDPGLIPGSGRSPGEGIGYPLQYSWASLVSVMAPPTMCDSAVLPCFHGCLTFLHRHFPPPSPPLHPLNPSLHSQHQPFP